MELRDLILLKLIKGGGASLIEKTATGNPASFTTQVAKALKSLLIPLTYSQEGSGDPSPDNIRPISGVSNLSAYRTGKNLYDRIAYPLTAGKWINGSNGDISSNNSYACTEDYIPCNETAGQTVTLNKHLPAEAVNPGIAFYKEDKTFLSGVKNNGETGTAWTFAVPNNAYFMRFTVPANSENIQLEIGTTATEFEPYDGTKLDVVFPALGKNLLKVTANSKTEAGVTYTVNSDGTITVSGTATGHSNLSVGTADISSAEKVRISGLKGNATNIVWDSFNLYDANNILVESVSGGGSIDNKTVDLTQYPTAVKMRVVIKRSGNLETSGTVKPMVEIGETSSAFEPYCNSVYGGSLDLVSGVLTIDRWMFIENGEHEWGATEQASNVRFILGKTLFPKYPKESSTSNLRVNYMKNSDSGNSWNAFIGSTGNFLCYAPTDVATTKSEWQAYLAEHPIQICYELETPYTVQLTPNQINAIKGNNTVWTDTSEDLTVTYYDKQ